MNPPVKLLAFGLLLTCLSTTCGCDSSGPKFVPVRGKITLNGGKWPIPGFLYFWPEEEVSGSPRLPGTAEFDADGNFVARTLKPGDGLMPGHYAVRVSCWKVAPTMANPKGTSYLPDKYADPKSSSVSVLVAADDDGQCNLSFDVAL